MHILENLARGRKGASLRDMPSDIPFPSDDLDAAWSLLERCPSAGPTPLVENQTLAARAGVGSVWIKDERPRMGLGSFKALGAAYVIASDAIATRSADLTTALLGQTYITASAGNHGLSVAAGAKVFGADAVVYIAQTVPESFADRLRSKGAKVVREGAEYEASMAAAARAAEAKNWHLLSDSSWPGYHAAPYKLMEGYLALMREVVGDIPAPPSHIFLQAGVGGMAAAIAAGARAAWGQDLIIVVVEPDAAPALQASIEADTFVSTSGPVSEMGRLDCKEASLIALKGLHRDADFFVTISEDECLSQMQGFAALGLETSPSGGAGIAGLMSAAAHRAKLGLTCDSAVLAILSEGPA